MKAKTKRDLTDDGIRSYVLNKLMDVAEAKIDLASIANAEYMRKLDDNQAAKIKRIIYGSHGNIVSVEPISIAEILRAMSEAAGLKFQNSKKPANGPKTNAIIMKNVSGGTVRRTSSKIDEAIRKASGIAHLNEAEGDR